MQKPELFLKSLLVTRSDAAMWRGCSVGCMSAQQLYDSEIAPCPRSPEWKVGARAGICKAFGLPHQSSPYTNGTAQDDARRSGFLMGYTLGCDAQTAQGAPA